MEERIKQLEEENRLLGDCLNTKNKAIKNLEEENKKLKSEIENMKEVGRENIETLDRMSIELENYSESFKRYRDFEKQELADSLYDMEQENKKLKEELGKFIMKDNEDEEEGWSRDEHSYDEIWGE